MSSSNTKFDWAVIGAGPAGIAAIGKLIDHGISPQNIAWIDPEFKVGDLGTKWYHVSSNTKVNLFIKFLLGCQSFNYQAAPFFPINESNLQETCQLSLIAEPLQWITNHLKGIVKIFCGKMQHLKLYERYWHITLPNMTLFSKNVILAVGSEPKSLSYSNIEEIPLTIALDPKKLSSICDINDTIAVFGSSHSAILILMTLIEKCNINKVINLYLSPLKYAVYFDEEILFDNIGLKGKAENWARENIDGKLPKKLQRLIANEENIRTNLPLCNKVIYAVGFQRRLIPIEGMRTLEYNEKNGIIAPGLFGLGIAFPEGKTDIFGNFEYKVGLMKFMDYLDRVMPIWLRYIS